MKIRDTLPAAIALFCALSCGYQPKADAPDRDRSTAITDEEFVTQFLTAWIVERDINTAREYLTTDFFVIPAMRRPAFWPDPLKPMAETDRVLRFPSECPLAPRECSRLSDCIESTKGEGLVHTETFRVDAQAIRSNPELGSREGRDLLQVDFMLKGCNVGAALIIDKASREKARVLSIVYLAG